MQPNACAILKIKEDMTNPGGKGEAMADKRSTLPPELLEIIWPALQVGGLTGLTGTIIGGFAGVLRSSPPILFALLSGIQWFTLGTTFWAAKGAVYHAWDKDKVTFTPRDKISASAFAGGVAGTAGGLLRGPRNVIPGAIMFALYGAAGQTIYNIADARHSELAQRPDRDLKNSILNSKWSPMKVLSDSEYENMLREKLLKVNADIALVDESIESLRVQERELEAKKAVKPSEVDKTK